MNREAGIVGRSRDVYTDVSARLRARGIEVVPFLTVGCLVAAFWLTLTLPSVIGAGADPARSARAFAAAPRPQVELRVIASVGGAAMPELHGQLPGGPSKGSRERGETPLPANVPSGAH